ncbi:MAG: hypothetical protein ACJ71P_07630 [Nitrososphaeraceae archaeon]
MKEYNKNNKRSKVGYLIGLSGIALALAFMISPNINNVLAQQNSTNPGSSNNSNNKTISITMTPNGQQQNPYSVSTSSSSQNWTGSISLFSPIIDAFKSKIHTTINDATAIAIKAVGGPNSSAVAAFIHPLRGFLVYDVFVLDSSNNIHRVVVDPGNARVLSNQPMSIMDMMGPAVPPFPPRGMMMQHGMMGGPSMDMMGPAVPPFPPRGMGAMMGR